MKTIIAGTDFTPSSLNACKYAALLAQKLNCKLIIFNLFQAPVLHTNSGLYGITYSSLKKTSEQSSQKIANNLVKDFPGLRVDAFVIAGAFDEELKLFVSRHRVQAVVMGLETKDRISKFIWGSHGVAIAGKISAPVILVPEKYREHRLETVLITVDNIEKLKASSLKPVEMFVKLCQAQVSLLHVRTPDEVISSVQGVVKINGVKREIDIQKSKTIDSGIKSYCSEHKVDLITVVSRKHSVFYNMFNESVTKRVAFFAKMPVMAIHE